MGKVADRERAVSLAGIEFGRFMLDLKEKHKLTHGEVFEILSDNMAVESAYLRRLERHGHYRKKACEE